MEDDVVDTDAFSGSNGDFVDQVGVRDGAPWLKCGRQLLKITDKDMILKGSFKFTIESIVNYKYNYKYMSSILYYRWKCNERLFE